MRFCTRNWITKILMRTISNVHAGRRFPTPALMHCVHLQDTVTISTCQFFSLRHFGHFSHSIRTRRKQHSQVYFFGHYDRIDLFCGH